MAKDGPLRENLMYKVYDYKCPTCGHVEKNSLQPSDTKEILCVNGTHIMERMLSAPRMLKTNCFDKTRIS